MAATAVIPSARPAVIRDFPDRLSPMLVKELRQGLKSPFFVWGLVVMQTALSIGAFVSMGQTENEAATLFWWGCTAVICILLPLRVANALRDEMSEKTMDTLVLTRLSAWRITLGKWLATVALQVLMAFTVLPYLIMRYFAGGVNLPQELGMMGVFLLFGMLATAVMLGLSFFRYFLIRAVIMVGVLMGCSGFCAGTIEELERHGTEPLMIELRSELGWSGAVGLVVLALWAGFFFLDLGASQIAPLAENRATRRRLVALAAFAVSTICFWNMTDVSNAMAWTALLFACGAITGLQAVCEKPADYAPVLRPFVKRGPAGRLAGRLLYPGWASGVVFSTLLLCGLAVVMIFLNRKYDAWLVSRYHYSYAGWGYSSRADVSLKMVTILTALAAVLVVPLVIWKLLARKSEWNFWRWLIIMLLPAGYHVTLALANSKLQSVVLNYAHGAFPVSGFFYRDLARAQASLDYVAEDNRLMEDYRRRHPESRLTRYRPAELTKALAGYEDERRLLHDTNLLLGSLFSSALWLLAAMLLAAREFRRIRTAEKGLALALQAPKTA